MDIRKLQRAIVDGLEDVKGQNIVVFNTEHLSPLFERVIIASGTSNRQTRSLAASVRDAVKAAGMPPPRVEGEANGEWIIVDCGAAVVHVMQPSFRDYYHLEELWGEKPVRMKLGGAAAAPRAAAANPAVRAPEAEASGGDGKGRSSARRAPASRAPAAKKAVTRTGGVKTPAKTSGARAAGKTAGAKTPGAKTPDRTSGRTAGAKAVPARSSGAGGRSASSGSTATRRRAAPSKAAASKKATPRTPTRKR
jgi:ribosome-associated protein